MKRKTVQAFQKLHEYYDNVETENKIKSIVAYFYIDGAKIGIQVVLDNGEWFSRICGDPMKAHRAITIILHEINPVSPIFNF